MRKLTGKLTVILYFVVLFLGIANIAMAFSISDDATGGDCYLIGNWDSTTKTCTLTTDVSEGIGLGSDYITLDGNGHAVTGTGSGSGVSIWYRKNVTVKNIIVSNFSVGMDMQFSLCNKLINNTVLNNNYAGIYVDGTGSVNSDYNSIAQNTVNGNKYGIITEASHNNTFTNNTISNNQINGIFAVNSFSNTFTGNNVSNNLTGVTLQNSSDYKIYNNNFIGNQTQAVVTGSSGNIFNLPAPTGGNYWSDFNSPANGCVDLNNDGFCDSPYYFAGGVDYLTRLLQIGPTPDVIPPTITITATPNVLWPPDGKLHDVLIDGSATGNGSCIANTVITVTDEYGVYNMTVPQFGSIIQLEARKKGTDKDGRIYTITVVATDMAGNQSTAITKVIVPHDMR